WWWGGRGVISRSNSGEAPGNHPPGPVAGTVTGEELEAAASGEQRIAAAFSAARDEGRAALMPYMMAGFPDRETSMAVAAAYADAGADLVELGVPFSDPLADGPTIHAAATASLAAGTTFEVALEVCESIAARVPVVLMAYANMILAHGGAGDFARRAAAAGAVGVIVPDLPLDEAEEVPEALGAAGLALVPLLAPTTPAERRARICAAAQGFVYVVSTVGTTGERQRLPSGLAGLVAATQADAEAPVAVGFGIGTPQQVADVGEFADGVIVGSRLVRAAGEAGSAESAAESVGAFLRDARSALAA
ncbi:MAG TPA: tryptophan synthase subunit alpha, partial [Solirubrobacterales bacterium]|nr:tryptophan synthase subunit alpha [Solirubrobacterales bacterium]